MGRDAWETAVLQDLMEQAQEPRSGWATCRRCRGAGAVPEQTSLDALPTGLMLICPVCLGLGKVPIAGRSDLR